MNPPSEATPRINGELLKQYVGRVVRLVGHLVPEKLSQQGFVIQTSDGLEAAVHSTNAVAQTGYVEVLGRVEHDLSVTEISSVSFGDDFGELLT